MKRAVISVVAFLLAAVTIMLPLALPARADEAESEVRSPLVGLKVNGALAQLDAVPGRSYVHRIIVENSEDYPGMQVEVKAFGLGETLDGGYRALNINDSNSHPYSAYKFISDIDIKSFHLPPGAEQVLKATIDIPATARLQGGRYAVIHIKPIMDKATNVLFIPEIYVPVILNFGGWDIKGKLSSVQVARVESGKPIMCEAVLQNTGNYHYKTRQQVVIKDPSGAVVAEKTSNLSALSLIPSYSFRIPVELEPEKPLPPATYSVEVKALLPDGKVLDTYRTSFDVTRNYVRFQAEAAAPVGTNWLFIGGTIAFTAAGAFVILSLARRRRI